MIILSLLVFTAVLDAVLGQDSSCELPNGNCLQTDTCSANSCANGGQCHQVNSTTNYRCYCRRGFSGAHCDVPIDECASGFCRNNGSCVNQVQPAGASCLCSPFFSGIYCDVPVNFCDDIPCLNNGTCRQDSKIGFQCTCPPGITGDRCEVDIDECTALRNPCGTAGKCRNTLGNYTCDCPAPYFGEHCESSYCSSSALSDKCQNGQCLMDVSARSGIRCKCSVGFTGEFCDVNVDECAGITCSGRGICVDEIAQHRCLCLPGWTGSNCELRIDECTNHQCRHNATCHVGTDHDYFCQCTPGYQGKFCENLTDLCLLKPCVHGACFSTGGDYACFCQDGWMGTNCSSPACRADTCLNGGSCSIVVEKAVCQCTPDWMGENCQIQKNPCLKSPCGVHGVCMPVTGGSFPAANSSSKFNCFCQPDYGGFFCEYRIDDCKGSQQRCFNGGICVDGIANFTCQCPGQFTGWRCESLSSPPTSATSVGATTTQTTPRPAVLVPLVISRSPTTTFTSITTTTTTSPTASSAAAPSSTSRTTTATTPTTSVPTVTTPTTVTTTVAPTTTSATTPLTPTTAQIAVILVNTVPATTTPLPSPATIFSTGTTTLSPGGSVTTTQAVLPTTPIRLSLPDLPVATTVRLPTTTQPPLNPIDMLPTDVFEGSITIKPGVTTTTTTGMIPMSSKAVTRVVPIVIPRNPISGARLVTSESTSTSTAVPSTTAAVRLSQANVPLSTTVSPRTTTAVSSTTEKMALIGVTSSGTDRSTSGVQVSAREQTDAAASLGNGAAEPQCAVCRNNGTCGTNLDGQFRCNCPLRFFGDLCENEVLITRAQFHGDGWLKYPAVSLRTGAASLQVAIRFLTDAIVQRNGTLFYAGSSTGSVSVRLETVNATALRLNTNCGDGYPLILTVTALSTILSDYSTVTFRQQFPVSNNRICSGELTWGNSVATSSHSATANVNKERINFDEIYLGGSPSSIVTYSGYVSNIAINGKDLDFDRDPISGMNVLQASQEICRAGPCQNGGVCLELVTGWMCACPVEFTGTLCELPACHPNPCLGGSTCVSQSAKENPNNGALQCVCPIGRYGMYCENEYKVQTNLHYFGQSAAYSSYATFAPIKNTGRYLEVTFNFTPSQSSSSAVTSDSSVMLLVGSPETIPFGGDFMLVALQRDVPSLLYNLGSGSLLVASSVRLNYTTSKTHKLTAVLDSDVGASITIDDAEPDMRGHPTGYTSFTSFQEIMPVSVGGFVDVVPLPGYISFNGTITHVQFRTHPSASFTPFSQVTAGRNVLPADVEDISACGSLDSSPCGAAACVTYGASYGCACGNVPAEDVCSAISVCESVQNTCNVRTQCVPDLTRDPDLFRCDCPLGKGGRFCEADVNLTEGSSLAFNGATSYLAFSPSPVLQTETRIQMKLRPSRMTGLLFFVAQFPGSETTDFVSLFFVDGIVQFRFNLGDSVTKSITSSFSLVNLTDQWATVEAGRNSTTAWLSVNGHEVSTNLDNNSLHYLDVFTNIYVGGIPNGLTLAASSIVENVNSFNGCLIDIYLNGKRYGLAGSKGDHVPVSGLNIQRCNNESNCGSNFSEGCHEPHSVSSELSENDRLCQNNLCREGGSCLPRKYSGLGYICSCRIRWTGAFCEFAQLPTQNSTSISFSNESYATVMDCDYDLKPKDTNYVSFRFRTRSADCVILWTGQIYTEHSDYFGVGLQKGNLIVSWNLGWTSKRTLFSSQSVRFDNDLWHKVTISRYKKLLLATISTENQPVIYVSGATDGLYTDLDTGGVYNFGGFLDSGQSVADLTGGLFSSTFVGCLADITLTQNGTFFTMTTLADGRNLLTCAVPV